MEALVLVTVLLGAVATVASLAALRSARSLKHQANQSALALSWFWGTVSAYMASFTVLRLAYMLNGPDVLLLWLFYVQTVTGAATVVSLAAIMCGAFLQPRHQQLAIQMFLALAVMTLTLVLSHGVTQTVADAWGVEYLPNNTLARILVAVVYMAMPVIMAVLVTQVSAKMPAATKRRLRLFSASVVLMYLPNAGKYVIVFEGIENAILAAIMMVGAIVGWRAYSEPEPAVPSGNG